MNKKILAIAMGCVLSVTTLAGCGKKAEEKVNANYPKGEVSYPVETDVTLKYWVRLSSSVSTSVQNYAETEFAKKYY